MSTEESSLDDVLRQNTLYQNRVYEWILGLQRTRPPVTSDPVMDLVVISPLQSAKFIRLMLLCGIVSGVVMSLPSACYLLLKWNKISLYENKLKWWLVINSLIQGVQVPIRMILYNALTSLEQSDNRVIIYCISLITSGNGWKLSRKITLINYLWFMMGICLLNKTKAQKSTLHYRIFLIIALNLIRMVITIIGFYRTFPPGLALGWRSSKGISKREISEIPLAPYDDKLEIKNVSCSICISEFFEGECLRILSCKHGFHKTCLDPWLYKNNACPLCMKCPTKPN